MADQLVGRDLRRREDPPLLTGAATYTDDISVPGMAHAAILRSQYGHATIESVDTAAAEALDGVVAVLTAADLEASDVSGVVERANPQPNGVETPFPILADERVRYVGEAVAVAVAEDRYTAHDALDRIDVAYDRQDAVVDARDALADDAPAVHEAAPDNVAFDRELGDPDAVAAAFDAADATVALDLRNQRLIGDPMEPRSVLVEPVDGTLAVTMASQTPYGDKPFIAEVLGLSEDAVEVVAPAVGGGFGIKGGHYLEECLVAWVARELDRPVKWTATRSETHAADYQSRDFSLAGELALADDGAILALRLRAVSNVGAYYVFPPSLFGNFEQLLSGQYAIPAISARGTGAFTNTAPTAPYRGAGRPECIYLVERLVREAARELGQDPVAFRRRNQIPADAFPYETALGAVYDSGDYERTMDVALEAVDYDALRERQAQLREDDRYLGIGLSCFVENTASSPGMGETGRVRLGRDGRVTATLGTHDHGQGHGTTFAQLLADELGLAYDDIDVVEGDTRDLPGGTGTFGSRSAALGGAAVTEAAQQVVEAARELAADQLEAAPADLEFADGAFHVAGAPGRAVHLQEVAELADDGALEATVEYDPPNYGFSFGTHVAVVEVDPDSGEVAFERYVAADDCGVVINPLIVAGQIHGGVAQGIAQALYEDVVYDDSGSLLSGSLQDYALPKAVHLPEMETHETETPSPHNPLGVKGTGESGTIAATPAVANAVIDALEPFGVDDIALPMTPERVWRAVNRED